MAKLKIHLSNLVDNYFKLKSDSGKAECTAVVKANAYGLGVEAVARALDKNNCKKYFVANLNEAIDLRSILPKRDIYVFNGFAKNEEKDFLAHNLHPVINNWEQLNLWKTNGKQNPCVIHVDSGMNRLGFDGVPQLEGLNVKMIMSHLACAEDKEDKLNSEQQIYFNGLKNRFRGHKFSLANSAGVYLGGKFHFDYTRTGIALYGGFANMKNVVYLNAKIIQIKQIGHNTSVGYGATYKAKSGDVIATLDIGYADGYMRSLGNKSTCYINGIKAPIVGRVSMDLITIDISALNEKYHQLGQEVEILGDNYTILDMAKDANTIPYEIITRLGSRFDKRYVVEN